MIIICIKHLLEYMILTHFIFSKFSFFTVVPDYIHAYSLKHSRKTCLLKAWVERDTLVLLKATSKQYYKINITREKVLKSNNYTTL